VAQSGGEGGGCDAISAAASQLLLELLHCEWGCRPAVAVLRQEERSSSNTPVARVLPPACSPAISVSHPPPCDDAAGDAAAEAAEVAEVEVEVEAGGEGEDR